MVVLEDYVHTANHLLQKRTATAALATYITTFLAFMLLYGPTLLLNLFPMLTLWGIHFLSFLAMAPILLTKLNSATSKPFTRIDIPQHIGALWCRCVMSPNY